MASVGRHAVKEEDRIILGDFNDNPFAADKDGKRLYSPALYAHMRFKGYTDFVTAEMKTTRLNRDLDSLIDHVLVNQHALEHISRRKAAAFWPRGGREHEAKLIEFRRTYSDHLPVSFELDIAEKDDDPDFFE